MLDFLPALDMPSLFFARALTQLFLAFGVAAITLRTGGKPAALWLIASLLAAVGWILLPVGLSGSLGHGAGAYSALVVLSAMLQIQAIAIFWGRALPWMIVIGVPAFTLLTALAFGLDALEGSTLMAVVVFLVLTIVPVFLAGPLRTRARTETIIVIGAVIGLNLVAAGARAVVGIFVPHLLEAQLAPGFTSLMPLLGTFAAMVLMNVGFVAMVKDGAERSLETLALQDSLTRLWNRRGLTKLGWHEVRRLQVKGRASSIVIVDIDRFKAINDRWGHDFGDKALVHLANLLRDHCREGDHAVRMGGEEFCLVLPGTDINGAGALVDRLRQRLNIEPFLPDTTPISFSAGIASVMPSDEGLQAAIGRADRALFRAKESGRNRSEIERDVA
jgi:diguanylate cyclase (GGDEF)-like protein